MLTVYGTPSSPGASTFAMQLAAHWASGGRQVLLLEADPAGGSLGHQLGIQFTPGTASFVASGLPALSNNLIDHAQDVLFENLHVMPAPAGSAGARGVFEALDSISGDLRAISESEMAVIVDGGRVTAETAASGLAKRAAGVAVVCRESHQLSCLEHLDDVLVPDGPEGGRDGPRGCLVTVGKSAIDPDEWLESSGLTYCGSIEAVADLASDLSSYLGRGNRKWKKWRANLEKVGSSLYPLAQPPESNGSRPRVEPASLSSGSAVEAPVELAALSSGPAVDAPVELAGLSSGPAVDAPVELSGLSSGSVEEAPFESSSPPSTEMADAPASVFSSDSLGDASGPPPAPVPDLDHPPTHHPPSVADAANPHDYPPPDYPPPDCPSPDHPPPDYPSPETAFQPAQIHYLPHAADPATSHPLPPAETHYLPPAADPATSHPLQPAETHYLPPRTGAHYPPPDTGPRTALQPARTHYLPPAADPAPMAYPPTQSPPAVHRQPPLPTHQPEPHVSMPYASASPERWAGHLPAPPQAAAYGQAPPVAGHRPAGGVEPGARGAVEPLPPPNLAATGSFRDWAVKLHGHAATAMTLPSGF